MMKMLKRTGGVTSRGVRFTMLWVDHITFFGTLLFEGSAWWVRDGVSAEEYPWNTVRMQGKCWILVKP